MTTTVVVVYTFRPVLTDAYMVSEKMQLFPQTCCRFLKKKVRLFLIQFALLFWHAAIFSDLTSFFNGFSSKTKHAVEPNIKLELKKVGRQFFFGIKFSNCFGLGEKLHLFRDHISIGKHWSKCIYYHYSSHLRTVLRCLHNMFCFV